MSETKLMALEQEPREMNLRPATVALLFERQPRESAKAFAAFSEYLSMGPQRSMAAVGKKLGKSEGLIERWSAKFDWPARVVAYGAHVAMIEREAIESLAREKAIEWHKVFEEQRIAEWHRRRRVLALADKLVERWEKDEKRCGTAEGIARLYELSSKLGRLASGMPTEHKEVVAEVKATLDVEWEIALKKVYRPKEKAETLKTETLKGEVVDVEEIGKQKAESGNGGQKLLPSAPAKEGAV